MLSRGHPLGNLPASRRLARGRARDRAARRHAPSLQSEPRPDGEAPDVPRRLLDHRLGASTRRRRVRRATKGKAPMADLVREIMIDTSPETIFEYRTSAHKIVDGHGPQ